VRNRCSTAPRDQGLRAVDQSPAGPLIGTAGRTGGWSASLRLAALGVVIAATLLTYWPTVHNGFLSLAFDDAIILDSADIRGLGWSNLRAMATEFNHAHYVPLTMLSLAVDRHFWGYDPIGYHLTNICLEALSASLALVFLWNLLPSLYAAVLAAVIFAVHPLQMEAVSLAIQRKTLLSGVFFFLTLILYQRWRRGGRVGWYVASVLAFAAAALAKPMAMVLPALLWLYEYVFLDGRLRLLDKLPFFAVAAPVGAAAMAAHAAVGAIHPPHGGSVASHVLMMGRVGMEYVAAAFLPANLSPVYYYPRAMAYAPLNFAAVGAILLAIGYVLAFRRRFPWTFFCLGWFVLSLLPESNIVPLAQLRADRFLYLPMIGVAVWVAIGVDRLAEIGARGRRLRLPAQVAGAVIAATVALVTHSSAGIWRSDVSAWSRVVARHPWSARAHTMLGRAYSARDDPARAEAAFRESLRIDPDLPDTHLQLGELYHRHGLDDRAAAELHRFLELAPADGRGRALADEMRDGRGS
jgi:hypothetical protein